VLDDVELDDIIPYIDWSPFFSAWELAGKYPKILADKLVGEVARKTFAEGRRCWIGSRGKPDRAPAASTVSFPQQVGDDIELYTDESRNSVLATFSHAAAAGGETEKARTGRSIACRFHCARSSDRADNRRFRRYHRNRRR